MKVFIFWAFVICIIIIRSLTLGSSTQDHRSDTSLAPAQALRSSIIQRIQKALPQPHAGLLAGITFGHREGITRNFNSALRKTGTSHIVVASGMNMALLTGFVFGLVSVLGRRLVLWICICLILFYTVLVGFDPPIVRAGIMAILASVGQMVGRQRSGVWFLLVSAALMLLVDPKLLHSLSFQLSFAATAGILLLGGAGPAASHPAGVLAPLTMPPRSLRPPSGSLLAAPAHILLQELRVTLAAIVFVLPILIHNFHQISILTPVTNVLISWTVGPIMAIGFIGSILSAIPLVGDTVLLFAYPLLEYFVQVVEWSARIPFAIVPVPEIPVWVWGVYYTGVSFPLWKSLRLKI